MPQTRQPRFGLERRRQGEHQHPAIDGYFSQARDAPGIERYERVEHPGGQNQAESGAEQSQHERFRQDQTQDPRAAGAERGANGDLASAPRGPRQQQVGQVHAGDTEKKPDGAEQNPQGAAQVVAGDPGARRERRETHPRVGARVFL